MGLLRLPDKVQSMVLDNELSMGHARVLSKIDENDKIYELANKVVANNMSVRELEDVSTHEEIKKHVTIKRKEKDNDYSYVEQELREMLGTRVNVSNRKMEIYFDSITDLNRILDILNVKIK